MFHTLLKDPRIRKRVNQLRVLTHRVGNIRNLWSFNQKIKVTVILVTYNHEPYIAQTLESILVQKTDFPFEILISEDCSTDKTRNIIIEYAKRYPEKIRLILSRRNVHTNRVLSRAIAAARGEYLAILDGDDYWISEKKLQKQADLLDERPECSLCFHDVWVTDDQERRVGPFVRSDIPETTGLERIIESNFLPTSSTMVRRAAVGVLPPWFDEAEYGDWPLWIWAARNGQIVYIKELLGVYRRHGAGAWSSLTSQQKLEGTLRCLETLERGLGVRYAPLIRASRARFQEKLWQELGTTDVRR